MSEKNVVVKRPGAIAILPKPPYAFGDAVEPGALEVLVIRRSAQVVAPGAVCFPGGGIEPNETPELAARREFREEVGLEIEVGSLLAQNQTPSGAPLFWFLARVDANSVGELKIDVQPNEVAEYEWRTLRELLDDPDFLPNNRAIVQAIVDGVIPLN